MNAELQYIILPIHTTYYQVMISKFLAAGMP